MNIQMAGKFKKQNEPILVSLKQGVLVVLQ
jgi:hypothetical protein